MHKQKCFAAEALGVMEVNQISQLVIEDEWNLFWYYSFTRYT